MTDRRIVRRDETREKRVGNSAVREYFGQTVLKLGLAAARLTGRYPPETEGAWALNERVEEMLYVVEGKGKLVFRDGEALALEPESAVHIPAGRRYRIEAAATLHVVISTAPAWSADQHKWSADGEGEGVERPERTAFDTKRLPVAPDAVAPDGSDVRLLLGLAGGGMAHFELGPGEVSTAMTHRRVDEIWYFLSGRGEMWRKRDAYEEIVPVDPGVCLTIPVGTRFQFRSFGHEPLAALGVTMPPWPAEGDATAVEGKWKPTVP
jgi:mannose-6-phosphate isomerase-like protein (cupin superfamily)